MIAVFGEQFQDWTSNYSLYSRERVDTRAIFDHVRMQVEVLGSPKRPLCVARDDTILRKRGCFIPGAIPLVRVSRSIWFGLNANKP